MKKPEKYKKIYYFSRKQGKKHSLLYENKFRGGLFYEAGYIIYDRESGRYNFFYTDGDGDRRDYGGIHCGEVFDFRLNGVWVPARVEMGDDRKWYLVGMPGLELDGLEVKAE